LLSTFVFDLSTANFPEHEEEGFLSANARFRTVICFVLRQLGKVPKVLSNNLHCSRNIDYF
jgi:hypothetical protein